MYVVTQTNGRLVLAGAAFCLLTVMCTRETLTDTLTESVPQGSPAEEEEENDDNNNNNNNDEDNNDEDRPQHGDESGAAGRANRLPLSRIKALMKADPDVSLASQESVFIIAKATELFVQMIAKDALVYTQQGKRKTLQRKDLDNAIEAVDELAFLEGTLD